MKDFLIIVFIVVKTDINKSNHLPKFLMKIIFLFEMIENIKLPIRLKPTSLQKYQLISKEIII